MELIELTFIPLTLLIVQAIKSVFPSIGKYAIATVLGIGTTLATLLVDWSLGWQAAIIMLLTYAVQITAGASGVYSWSKKENLTVELPDYSDEK